MPIEGDRIVVGYPFDDDNGEWSGSVYGYEPDGAGDWDEIKLTASDSAAGDFYGQSLVVAGDRSWSAPQATSELTGVRRTPEVWGHCPEPKAVADAIAVSARFQVSSCPAR